MNLRQVTAGLAWHYKKYQKEQTPADRDLYSEAEIMARENGQGEWARIVARTESYTALGVEETYIPLRIQRLSRLKGSVYT
ncbi:MAG: hypothetical protein ABFS45_16195 [Pseudomonadota bacterium]